MKLIEIDKALYRKRLNIVIVAFIATLTVVALLFGAVLIELFATPITSPEVSNFRFNLLGVILALICSLSFLHFVILIFSMSSKNKSINEEYQLPKEFTMKIGLGFILSDILGDTQRKIRPYEINSGETDEVFKNIRKKIGKNCGTKKGLYTSLKEAKVKIEAIPINAAQLKTKINITGEIGFSLLSSSICLR